MLYVKDLYARLDEIDKELENEYKDGETCYAANLEVEKERIEEAISILEENNIKECISKIVVSDIKWEKLKNKTYPPKEIEIPMNEIKDVFLLEDIEGYADYLSDYLSDKYGYLHYGFSTSVEKDEESLNQDSIDNENVMELD